ncbi:PE family protein [Mycobacterium sp. 1423905.2]|uniref:PE family protein n=1 Tax=Mycobacterium sp. 1423905.2 TaxID=1856859 RepID=UPI0007FDC8C2|nr:PE family protein [Mycobacterium sp. 1423905.2]OBJ61255.1 hypothetical protein A9W95_09760 [Mycobacterium sp. 1423905.2]
MSYVIASPEYVAAAAADLGRIATAIGDANTAAVVPTSTVLSAGIDEVSIQLAALFDAHAQAYQALSAQAAAFHDQFVQLMSMGADQYALTEVANNSTLQTAEQGLAVASSSAQALSAPPPAAGVPSTPLAAVHPSVAAATVAPVRSAQAVAAPASVAVAPMAMGPALAATFAVPAAPAATAATAAPPAIEPLPAATGPGVASPNALSALPANLATRAVPAAQQEPSVRFDAVTARTATAE